MNYKPKPGHVWQYINNSWIEVPRESLGTSDIMNSQIYHTPFEGPIVGLNETVTSHDAVKEYLSRTLVVELDEDSTAWSAIRFYEDVLLWRAFGDDTEVFENLCEEEIDRLKVSFAYIRELDEEQLSFTVMIAIQEMEF
jgi:hypothetical protein